MILHIPHSSTTIPEIMACALLISNSRLQQETVLMTDPYYYDLYQYPGANRLVSPWSRLCCDVGCFEDDAEETMSEFGQRMFYTRIFRGYLCGLMPMNADKRRSCFIGSFIRSS